jgi:hypothetical protein
MSYAGPISRAKASPDAAPGGISATLRTPRPPARWPGDSDSDARSPALIFAVGIAVGIALGAGAALLLAPDSGLETRRALVRRGRHAGRRSRDAWDDLRDEFRNAVRNRKRSWRRGRRSASEAP